MPNTRFAPSPTGYLHLGHAYSALFAYKAAHDGQFHLRIEDIDAARCKPEFTEAIYEDLMWLGLTWIKPVRHQSEHLDDYAAALNELRSMGLIYPCFCTRKEILKEAARAGGAPHADDGTLHYSGTCRHLSLQERQDRLMQNGGANWRLDVGAAYKKSGPLTWYDVGRGTVEVEPHILGDVVLARKDTPTSYHLSVTVDDHLQAITLVTRGEDLIASTHIHRLLQALLGYATPAYHHHALRCDETGKRFAKRDNSMTLRALRSKGVKPELLSQELGF